MPWPQTPLPHPFSTTPFSSSAAQAAGISEGALRNPRFDRPFHGVRVLRSEESDPQFTAERARATARMLVPRLRPGEAFSHTTALVLHGCPIRVAPTPHITIPLPGSRSVARGVIGHTSAKPFTPWVDQVTGAHLTDPIRAFIQSARLLPFPELVVAADHLLRSWGRERSRPLTTPAELSAAAHSARSSGIARVRDALELARVGAESRMETLLRLIMITYGIDVFELQVDLYDEGGRWIGRFDMVDLERKLIVEYDGEQHRTSTAQYARDAARLEAAREAGFRVLRFRRSDVLDHPRRTARRIARALGLPLIPCTGDLAQNLGER